MRSRTAWLGLLGVILAVVSVPYLGRGLHRLLTVRQDLQRRWAECQYVLHGQDPFQPILGQYHGPDPAASRRECDRLAATYGVLDGADYPAWSYAPALLFVWPPAGVLPPYYAVLSGLGIAVLVGAAVRLARPTGGVETGVVAVGVLAMSGVCSTLGNGNFGIVVVAALALSLWLDRRGRTVLAGALFWVALLKPTITAPFALFFLLHRRWGTLAVAGSLALLGCLLPWWLDHVDPIRMTLEAVAAAREYQSGGYGPLTWVTALGVPLRLTTPVTAAVVAVPTALYLAVARGLPAWRQLAVIAVAGRLWAYHLAHDNVMLLFLLAACWRAFFSDPGPVTTAVLLAVGLTLWTPSRLEMHASVGLTHVLVWAAAAVHLAAGRGAGVVGDRSPPTLATTGPI